MWRRAARKVELRKELRVDDISRDEMVNKCGYIWTGVDVNPRISIYIVGKEAKKQ